MPKTFRVLLSPIAFKIRQKVRKILHLERFNSIDSTNALDFVNLRPMPPNAFRVLFIGDSLMMHGRTKGLWAQNCGMAASAPDKDYVHLVVAGIQQTERRPVEALYNNGGNGKLEAMLTYMTTSELMPDLVILQGGENDSFGQKFKNIYRTILDFYRVPTIVLGDWWSAEKSAFSQQEANRRNFPFVSLVEINGELTTGNGGPYCIPGVAHHPNDRGMEEISRKILEAYRTTNLPLDVLA